MASRVLLAVIAFAAFAACANATTFSSYPAAYCNPYSFNYYGSYGNEVYNLFQNCVNQNIGDDSGQNKEQIKLACSTCLCPGVANVADCFKCLSYKRPYATALEDCLTCSKLQDDYSYSRKHCYECLLDLCPAVCTNQYKYVPYQICPNYYKGAVPTCVNLASYGAPAKDVSQCWTCMAQHKCYVPGSYSCSDVINNCNY